MSSIFNKHSELLAILNTMLENKIVASYAGPFYNDILTLLAESIEKSLWRNESLGRRFFKIFIELSQNIALYSAEKSKIKDKIYGSGTMIISDYDNYFLFTAGNTVNQEQKKFLEDRINQINKLDRLELRALKRKLRKEGNQTGGGNIGLTQVALISKKEINYQFYPIENNMFFFLINVEIHKD